MILVYICIQTFTNPTPTGRLSYALPIFLVWLAAGALVLVAHADAGPRGLAAQGHTGSPRAAGDPEELAHHGGLV